MSLRTRLMAALITLSVVSVAVVAGWTAWDTSRRLRDEVSTSLDRAAASLVDPSRPGGPSRPRPGPPDGSVGRPREFDRILYQLLDGAGEPMGRSSELTLPVTGADRAVAGAGGAGVTARRDVNVQGETFEVLTVSLGAGVGAVQVARSLDEVERVVSRILGGTLVVLLIVSVLAGFAGWWLARQIARPIVALADAAASVATTGRLDIGVEGSVAGQQRGAVSNDEVVRLAGSFATMLDALRTSKDAQQRLVQDAGHELRTPLTSLRANAALLRRVEELDPSTRAAVVADVDAETQELSTLVNELVALAADGVDSAEDPIVEFDLAELARAVAERAERRSGRPVRVTATGGRQIVTGRRAAVVRAVRNLVDNAVKFDESGGAIELTVDGSQVEVADRGPGVPDTERERIFERFHRTDEARSRPGSGLGLAIVAAVAQEHGGTCWARSRDGGGLIVGFSLGSVRPAE